MSTRVLASIASLGLLLVVLGPLGCDADPARFCEPESTQYCNCPDGSWSEQVCSHDGSAWQDCVCRGGDGDGDADGDGDGDGDSDGDGGCAERVFAGDVEVSDPASLEGIVDYTRITGTLTIVRTPLMDLNGLECLTRVGHLHIGECDTVCGGSETLTSLEGLDSLTTIDGELHIIENDALEDLAGLSALRSVGGELVVQGNDRLISLAGLESVSSIGRIELRENQALLGLDGLSSLTYTLGLELENNDALTTLEGLGSLTETSYLIIRENDSLESLRGLESLGELEFFSTLTIVNNDSLTSLEGLHNLTAGMVENSNFMIAENPELRSLEGLRSLRYVWGLYLHGNDSLTTLGLESLETVDQLEIIDHASLENLDGLSALRTALVLTLGYCSSPAGDCDENPRLSDISALSGLELIESLRIHGNESLTSLDAFASLESVGGLEVIANDGLTSLGLDTLSSVPWHFEIRHNASLPSCEAENLLAQLDSPPETFLVENNDDEGGCE